MVKKSTGSHLPPHNSKTREKKKRVTSSLITLQSSDLFDFCLPNKTKKKQQQKNVVLASPRNKGCNKGFRHGSDTADTNSEAWENATPKALEQINILSTSSPWEPRKDATLGSDWNQWIDPRKDTCRQGYTKPNHPIWMDTTEGKRITNVFSR